MVRLPKRLMTRLLDGVFGAPEPLVETLFGSPPRHDRGAPLDPQLHVLLSLQQILDPPDLHERSVEGAREYFAHINRLFDRTPPSVETIDDRTIEGPAGELDLRVYHPGGERGSQLPGCVFYHGGGFVVGDIETYDGLCQTIAARANCGVVSVEYRRAPEHPFPAAIDDATAAFRWVRDHAERLGFDPTCLTVAGDSAGGNIATVVCQRQLADDRPLPEGQFLLYPKTDHRSGYRSRERFAEDFYLTDAMIAWFSEQYLGGTGVDAETDPRVSPLQFDRLDEMPPAVVATAGFDPLRDEGKAYAERLRSENVPVVHRRFDRLVHGFATMGGVIDAAARATTDIIDIFRRELRSWRSRRDKRD